MRKFIFDGSFTSCPGQFYWGIFSLLWDLLLSLLSIGNWSIFCQNFNKIFPDFPPYCHQPGWLGKHLLFNSEPAIKQWKFKTSKKYSNWNLKSTFKNISTIETNISEIIEFFVTGKMSVNPWLSVLTRNLGQGSNNIRNQKLDKYLLLSA